MMKITDKDVARAWDGNAAQWAKDVTAGLDVYRDLFTMPAFLEILPDINGLKLIDFGCGEGTNTRAFAKLGAEMSGCDISSEMIKFAKDAEAKDPLGIAYHISSYRDRLPYDDCSFDAVVSTLALMDGPKFDEAMMEAYRILKPDGFLQFSVLHPCFITPDLLWQKSDDGLTTGKVISKYFQKESFSERWSLSARREQNMEDVEPFHVPRFPRTMSDYINGVAKAGFTIEQINEPQPSEAAIKALPKLIRWREHVAFLLIVRARKVC